MSKVLLNVFATGSGTVTAGQLSLADRRGLAGVIVILIERFGRLSPMGLSSV